MSRKKLLITFATVVAFALMVWTIGATVNLTPINFNATSGDVVSASEFDSAFGTINSNFDQLKNAVVGSSQGVNDAGSAVNAGTPVNSAAQSIVSSAITVPASGYVLAMASTELYINKDGGTVDLDVAISESGTSYSNEANRMRIFMPSAAAAGEYWKSHSQQFLFPVPSAGTYTYHLIVGWYAGEVEVDDSVLSLAYIPMDFGAVDTASAGVTELAPSADDAGR